MALLIVGTVIFLQRQSTHTQTTSNPESASAPGVAGTTSSATASRHDSTVKGGTADRNPLADLVRIMRDSSLSIAQRKEAMEALARNGSHEALLELKKVLADSPSDVRVAVTEALGQCHSTEGVGMLVALLNDSDFAVAKAAVQGLSQTHQAEAMTALSQLVTDNSAPVGVRCEAALALGATHEPWVLDPLSRAAKESTDEDVAMAALNAIGGLDFNTTKAFYEDFLQSPNVSCDLQIAAVESLVQAEGDTSGFLAKLAATSSDPEIRLAAAWALSATQDAGNLGPDVLALIGKEADPDVRLRLYQALANQQSFDVNAAISAVQNEADPSARVAGFDMLAKALRDNPTPELQRIFDEVAIPELRKVALTGASIDDRQAAIIALARANTPGALAALGDLRNQIPQPQSQPPPRSLPGRRPQIGSN
ncbi:MAG TPA: HEAT repeat domain-containing protein [Verrucomicrobiae bacterium]|nr:HEAT repeat domain-containing protein [Verrucomicrobiae bacterium]